MDEYGSESAIESIPITVAPEVTLTTPISGRIKVNRRRMGSTHNWSREYFTGFEFNYALSSNYDIESITYDYSFDSDRITFRKTEKVSGSQLQDKRNVDYSIHPFSKSTWEEYWNTGNNDGAFPRSKVWKNAQLTISVLLSNGKTYKFKGKLDMVES